MSRIKKSDRLKMELVLLVMMIAAGYFICRESGVRGVKLFHGTRDYVSIYTIDNSFCWPVCGSKAYQGCIIR